MSITVKNWVWDPIVLTTTDNIVWDSGKFNVNWKSKDGFLTIINGVWHIKQGFKWNGTTAFTDYPWLSQEEAAKVPVICNKNKIPYTWLATLIHDIGCFYVITDDSFPYTRAEVDDFFYKILKSLKFKYAKLYWFVVRLYGIIFPKQLSSV